MRKSTLERHSSVGTVHSRRSQTREREQEKERSQKRKEREKKGRREERKKRKRGEKERAEREREREERKREKRLRERGSREREEEKRKGEEAKRKRRHRREGREEEEREPRGGGKKETEEIDKKQKRLCFNLRCGYVGRSALQYPDTARHNHSGGPTRPPPSACSILDVHKERHAHKNPARERVASDSNVRVQDQAACEWGAGLE